MKSWIASFFNANTHMQFTTMAVVFCMHQFGHSKSNIAHFDSANSLSGRFRGTVPAVVLTALALKLQKPTPENGTDEGDRAAEDAAPNEIDDRYDQRPVFQRGQVAEVVRGVADQVSSEMTGRILSLEDLGHLVLVHIEDIADAAQVGRFFGQGGDVVPGDIAQRELAVSGHELAQALA